MNDTLSQKVTKLKQIVIKEENILCESTKNQLHWGKSLLESWNLLN
jgi:hypothetical protein